MTKRYSVGGKGKYTYERALARAAAIHRRTGVFVSIEEVR